MRGLVGANGSIAERAKTAREIDLDETVEW